MDIATTQIIMSLNNFERFDISIPLYAAGPVLMVPWPGEESRLLAAIRPFQSTVIPLYIYIHWLTIILIIQLHNT